MGTTRDLRRRGFQPIGVTPNALNIQHADPAGRGPFCRLIVHGEPPAAPGVYAWVANGQVRYVGRAGDLRQIINGARMNRAYNDYTYVPPSKLAATASPRVRVDGLLNRELVNRATVEWWWLRVDSVETSKAVEAALIHEWAPPWNRAHPLSTPTGGQSCALGRANSAVFAATAVAVAAARSTPMT